MHTVLKLLLYGCHGGNTSSSVVAILYVGSLLFIATHRKAGVLQYIYK